MTPWFLVATRQADAVQHHFMFDPGPGQPVLTIPAPANAPMGVLQMTVAILNRQFPTADILSQS